MTTHRQSIESAWEGLLEVVAEAAREARAQKRGKHSVNRDAAPKLETLLAAIRGLGNAWAEVRDLLPSEPIKSAEKSEVAGALPQSRYWKPLAQALLALGGKARTADAITEVGSLMAAELGPVDRELLSTGQVRWIANTRFARQRLKEHGLISRNSPSGVWELTDAGARWAASTMTRLPPPVEEPDPRQPPLPF